MTERAQVPDDAKGVGLQSLQRVGKLITGSVTGLVDLPGVHESAQATRSIVAALKPDFLQAPERNDVNAQKQTRRLEELITRVGIGAPANNDSPEPLQEEEHGSPDMIQLLVRDLEDIKTRVTKTNDGGYLDKLSHQADTAELLECLDRKSLERIIDFCVDGSIQANHSATQTSHLMHDVQLLTGLFAQLDERLEVLETAHAASQLSQREWNDPPRNGLMAQAEERTETSEAIQEPSQLEQCVRLLAFGLVRFNERLEALESQAVAQSLQHKRNDQLLAHLSERVGILEVTHAATQSLQYEQQIQTQNDSLAQPNERTEASEASQAPSQLKRCIQLVFGILLRLYQRMEWLEPLVVAAAEHSMRSWRVLLRKAFRIWEEIQDGLSRLSLTNYTALPIDVKTAIKYREDIWNSALSLLFSFYQRVYPPTSISSVTVPALSSSPRRSIRLPEEILDNIFSFYITNLVDDLRCSTVRDYRIRKKDLMQDISALALCSKQFHRVMTWSLGKIWASCGLGQCSQERYYAAPARSVWIITAEQGCLPPDTYLAVHITLKIASINYHDGVQWSNEQRRFLHLRCISAYPRSLRQLEILHLHTPEEEVIRLVSDCCPGLTELRLVRCTMFNDPKCWYWRVHTSNQDHDYMQSDDPTAVIDYANRMALLLRGLQQLESIHIGHYLITINAVFTHRIDHKRHHPIADTMSHVDGAIVVSNAQLAGNADGGPPIDWRSIRLADRRLWASPCPQCEREFKRPIERAERLAAGILAAHFKFLKHASFANFLSDRRIAPSSWLVGRQWRGPDLYVRTEDPNRPRSRIMQEMVRLGDRWLPMQLQKK